MYEVSKEYLEAVANRSRLLPTRCLFEGMNSYITNKHIRSGTFTNTIDGNSILSMGNACSNMVEMTISNFTTPYVWKGARFALEKGLYVAGSAEWIPWGTFWVTDKSTSNDNRTVYLTAYDYMYTLSKKKYTTALVAPFHYRELLDEFLLKAGMTLRSTVELPDAKDEDYDILSWPEGEYSYSDIAGHLAGMLGCNARIAWDDPTVMEFVWYTPTATVIKDTLYQDGFEKLADDELRVDYLICGDNVLENTDGKTDGKLDFSNFDEVVVDSADVPWLAFTYDEENLTASVALNSEYADRTEPIDIPYLVYYKRKYYNVTSVESKGFMQCQSAAITLPKTLETIGDNAFYECTSLESITIPENVTSIGKYAFYNCTALEAIYFNATNCTVSGTMGWEPFGNCSNVTLLAIGDNVTYIPDYAFGGLKGLKIVTIPEKITYVGKLAFRYAYALETIYFNAKNCTGQSSMAGAPFGDSKNVSQIILGEKVTTIPQCMFEGCNAITSLNIPASVTSIGSLSFRYATLVTDVIVHKPEGSIANAPWGCSNATIHWVG